MCDKRDYQDLGFFGVNVDRMSLPYAPRYGGEESFIVDSGELRCDATVFLSAFDRAISELLPHQPQKKYLKYVCHRSMAEGTVMKLKQDLASANRERLELLVSRRSWS